MHRLPIRVRVQRALLVGLIAGATVIATQTEASAVQMSTYLRAVAAVSASNAWAVGGYSVSRGGVPLTGTIIEHWDGTAWNGQKHPSKGGDTLHGVAATSPMNAWVVGQRDITNTDGTLTVRTLIEHWNGATWTVQKSPNPGTDAALSGVAAVSAKNAWAVGTSSRSNVSRTLILHWDGSSWKAVPTPNTTSTVAFLSGVATSPAGAWAVGAYSNGTAERPLIEHWNFRAWKVVPSPNVGSSGNSLSGVTFTSATDGWAVGSHGINGGLSRTLIERWNGTAWGVQRSPKTGSKSDSLSSVAATSATDAWGVGVSSGALIEHWNGSAWGVQTGPKVGPNYLSGVAATSPTNAWAAGARVGLGGSSALIEHWDGTAWSVQTSPT